MTLGFPSFVGPGAADIGSTIAGGTPGSVLFVGAGSVLAQDNANFFWDDTNNRFGLATNAPTHTLTLGSTGTGIAIYSTPDQTTNFQRLRTYTSGNANYFDNEVGGTGAVGGIFLRLAGVTRFGVSSSGAVRYTPTSTQTLSAGTATTVNSSLLKVQGNAAPTTITAAPSIADGVEGDLIIIQGQNSSNTVTYQDQGTLAGSNLRLQATTRVLGARDSLVLMFDGTDWVEVSFSNVL